MEHRKAVFTQHTDDGAGLRLNSGIGAPGSPAEVSNRSQKGKPKLPHSMAMLLALRPIQHLLRKRSTPTDQPTSFLNMSEPLETHEYICQPMTDWLGRILGIRKIKND